MSIRKLEEIENSEVREPITFQEFHEIKACLDNIDFIEDLLCVGNVSVIYGAPKSGKTFFTIDMALRLSASMKFYDQEVDGGAVLYIGLEGQKAIINRIAASRKHLELQDNLPFRYVTEQIDLLSSKDDAYRIIDLINQSQKDLETPLRLVIIDTWSRATPGNQENTGDTNAAFANVDFIKDQTEAHICLVHHSGKDESSGARGSNIMIANPDLVMRITKDKGSGIHTARIEETRWADNQGREFNFTIEGIELGENTRGKKVFSGVVVPTRESPSKLKISGSTRKAYKNLCDLMLSDFAVMRAPKNGMKNQRCVLIKDFRNHFEKANICKSDKKTSIDKAFGRVLENLEDARMIVLWDDLLWLLDKPDNK